MQEAITGTASSKIFTFKNPKAGNSPVGQWLGLCTLTVSVPGSTSGQGTKIPKVTQYSQKKKITRQNLVWPTGHLKLKSSKNPSISNWFQLSQIRESSLPVGREMGGWETAKRDLSVTWCCQTTDQTVNFFFLKFHGQHTVSLHFFFLPLYI